MRLRETAVGALKTLRVASSKAAVRDTIRLSRCGGKARVIADALAEFRREIQKVPGVWANRNGRVYLPVQQVAANPAPIISAVKRLRSALG